MAGFAGGHLGERCKQFLRTGCRKLGKDVRFDRRAIALPDKGGHRGVKQLRSLDQHRRADAIGAALVLLNLLKGDAQAVRQPRLAPAKPASAQTHPRANGDVDRIRPIHGLQSETVGPGATIFELASRRMVAARKQNSRRVASAPSQRAVCLPAAGRSHPTRARL